ncbi:glycosyltransferase family 2 protein [Candidatus Parcubacteria bacterium]|nr:glycosyltransferase family 2 protein [Candidatus Parcubacteria bacterium]
MPRLSAKPAYRFLETIPGTLVWVTFFGSVVLSYYAPLIAIYIIILFDLYWLIKAVYWLVYLCNSYRHFRRDTAIDWLSKLKAENPISRDGARLAWGDLYHLIFLPTFREPFEVLDATFAALVASNYPPDRFMVSLGVEEGDKENGLHIAERIREKYGRRFFSFWVTVHPRGLPGEQPGKGSNNVWAARHAKEQIDKLKVPYERIIVSAFDVDTVVHREYFGHLAYQFLTHPAPHHTSYQPVALFNNNIWQSNLITRTISNGTTFWLLTDLSRPDRLFTFSSHSMSWKTLVAVGFWEPDLVTEDSRIFLQCFLHYDGNYTVTPMYVPVSMDTVETGSFWGSLAAVYRQQRRWAWGIEHFPYMVWHFWRNRTIPFMKKFKYFFNLAEGMYSWATAPILIIILGRLPLFFADRAIQDLTTAMVGLAATAVLSLVFLPPVPRGEKHRYLMMFLQWILFPVNMIFFGSIPAIEAQTRLATGRYLGFTVTKKNR